jgi:hypothetical protein
MKRFFLPLIALFVMAGLALAAGVKSGLEVGDAPAPFNVKDITGPSKGTSLCYRCKYGAKPVACVFTREITDEVKALIQGIDKVVTDNKEKEMSAFVVLLTDNADTGAKQLEKLGGDIKAAGVPLTVFDGNAGPADYKISKDAAVTVLLWNKSRVAANHAFAAGKMTADDVKTIVGDTAKVLK